MSHDTPETHDFLACMGCSAMIVVRQPGSSLCTNNKAVVTFATTYCTTCNNGKIKIESVTTSSIRTAQDLKNNTTNAPFVAADMVTESTPFKLVNTYIARARLPNTQELLEEVGFGVPIISISEYRKLFPPTAKINSVNTDSAHWTEQSILSYLENRFC